MEFPSRKSIHGIIQTGIQFKGGMDELSDFLDQIANFDPTFDKMKYINENFESEKLLKSDIIHLPPFKVDKWEKWSPLQKSNPQPNAYKAFALPLS